MSTPISVKEKRDFIQWFLRRFRLKKRESVWVLKYLLTHDSYLTHVHFVQDVSCCPRGMIISTTCSEDIAFRYHKLHIVTDDPDKIFHDIRLNKFEPLYVQLNFNNGEVNPLFITILEDNPYLPTEHINRQHDAIVAEEMLTYTLLIQKKKNLQHQVNIALDENDKLKFVQLANELRHLEEKLKHGSHF